MSNSPDDDALRAAVVRYALEFATACSDEDAAVDSYTRTSRAIASTARHRLEAASKKRHDTLRMLRKAAFEYRGLWLQRGQNPPEVSR